MTRSSSIEQDNITVMFFWAHIMTNMRKKSVLTILLLA